MLFDPSLHFVPLSKNGDVPLLLLSEDGGSIATVTNDGRISWFPACMSPTLGGKGWMGGVPHRIKETIKEEFPSNKVNGERVKQYLMICVMYDNMFVFRIIGLLDENKELNHVYEVMSSIRTVPKVSPFGEEPISSWANRLITQLKNDLNWAEYVKKKIDRGLAANDQV